MALDEMAIVGKLTALPHRGVATAESANARKMLVDYLQEMSADVEEQAFRTPPTYIPTVTWFIGGMLLGLVLLSFNGLLGLFFVVVSGIMAWRFLDYRYSYASSFPPHVTGHNIIGRFSGQQAATKKLILMAHYDTAPISYLYRPEMVKDFVRSMRISIGIMIFAVIFSVVWMLGFDNIVMQGLRVLLMVYFAAQWLLSAIDYWRYGFSNGASDNTTGVAVVLAVAESIKSDLPEDWSIDVVLTDAEEAQLIGAQAYYRTYKNDFPAQTYLLNIDTVGQGKLKIFTETGTLTNIVYDNALVDAAKEAATEEQFADVEVGSWRTGDFDTAWFARGGIACLTLGAQNENAGMPNIHRPNDTIDNVDELLLQKTVEFVKATVKRLV